MTPKRDAALILEGSFCDVNLYANGPMTVEEAKKIGPSPCPNFEKCRQEGFLDSRAGHQCAMCMGLRVAQHVLKTGNSVGKEIINFEKERILPPKGWIFSSDRVHFEIASSCGRACLGLVEKFAYIALGLEPPEKFVSTVGPDFQDVICYVSGPDGVVTFLKWKKWKNLRGSLWKQWRTAL
jgi:hypothetical protein